MDLRLAGFSAEALEGVAAFWELQELHDVFLLSFQMSSSHSLYIVFSILFDRIKIGYIHI